jgi:Phosphoesterase family
VGLDYSMRLARREVSNEAGLLMLRHENAVPRRQTGRVRYQPGDRLWLVALSRLIPRRRWVFDHWFSEVPSQTFMNRSFWTAATSSGLAVNLPARKWFTKNDAETIFERLEQHGRTWKVYVMEPMCLSFTGVIHYPRLRTGWRRAGSTGDRSVSGIMWVAFGHLRPSGHIMPDHAGDRGAVFRSWSFTITSISSMSVR